MSHVPAKAMPHARSRHTEERSAPARRWPRLWLVGGLAAATTLAALGALRVAS